jgi:uncharacterized repeat protein (TIGR04138 family)
MSVPHPQLVQLARQDGRYAPEAYEFVIAGYHYTQKLLGRSPPRAAPDADPSQHHVTGRQLLEGIVRLAQAEFGLMAWTVFCQWGIRSTDDFGEIVFRLVDAGLMTKTEEDSRQDFAQVFDLEAVLSDYDITLDDRQSRL